MAAHIALVNRHVAIQNHLIVFQRTLQANCWIAWEAILRVGCLHITALHDQDLIGVAEARQALIREVLQQVRTLFAPYWGTVLHNSRLNWTIRLHVCGILDEEVSDEHEILDYSTAGLGCKGWGQWVCFEPLVEVVLPQQRLKHILLRIDFILRNHCLSPQLRLLLLVFVDPNRDLLLVLLILPLGCSVALPIFLWVTNTSRALFR